MRTVNVCFLELQLITFQRKRANRRIINEAQLLDLLRTYAPVQVVEFNSSHSFAEQLTTVSKTGIFVSVRCLDGCSAVVQTQQVPPTAEGQSAARLLKQLFAGTYKQFGEFYLPATRSSSR